MGGWGLVRVRGWGSRGGGSLGDGGGQGYVGGLGVVRSSSGGGLGSGGI